MKTDKNGKIVLQKGDYRTGNFVFHRENRFIKVMAVSGIVSWRISTDTAAGRLISIALQEKRDAWLQTYAAMNLSQLCVVPDSDYFVRIAELINSQTAQHPEFYGKEKTESKDEDDKILQEERELQEAVAEKE